MSFKRAQPLTPSTEQLVVVSNGVDKRKITNVARPQNKRPRVESVGCTLCKSKFEACGRLDTCLYCNSKLFYCESCHTGASRVCVYCTKENLPDLETPVECKDCNFLCVKFYYQDPRSADTKFCHPCSRNHVNPKCLRKPAFVPVETKPIVREPDVRTSQPFRNSRARSFTRSASPFGSLSRSPSPSRQPSPPRPPPSPVAQPTHVASVDHRQGSPTLNGERQVELAEPKALEEGEEDLSPRPSKRGPPQRSKVELFDALAVQFAKALKRIEALEKNGQEQKAEIDELRAITEKKAVIVWS